MRRAASALAVAIMMMGLAAPPALADQPCDFVVSAAVDGSDTVGDLDLSVVRSVDGLTYTAAVPAGYSLEWLDGAHRVVQDPFGISVGGGVLTRSASITGEFVHISACLVERAHRSGPIPL